MDRLDDTALRSMLGTLCARALAKAPAGLGPHAKKQRKVSRKYAKVFGGRKKNIVLRDGQ